MLLGVAKNKEFAIAAPDAGLQVPHEVHPRELLGLCEAGVPRVLGVRAAQSGEHGAGGGEGWWDFSFEVPCRNADGQPLGVAFPDRPKTENDHWQTSVRVMARPPPAQPVGRCPALCGESCYQIMARSSKALFQAAFDTIVQPPHVLVLRTDSSLGWDFSLAILCTACAAAKCGPQTRDVHGCHVVVIDVDAGASQRTQGSSIDRTCPSFTEAPYIFGGSGGACFGDHLLASRGLHPPHGRGHLRRARDHECPDSREHAQRLSDPHSDPHVEQVPLPKLHGHANDGGADRLTVQSRRVARAWGLAAPQPSFRVGNGRELLGPLVHFFFHSQLAHVILSREIQQSIISDEAHVTLARGRGYHCPLLPGPFIHHRVVSHIPHLHY